MKTHDEWSEEWFGGTAPEPARKALARLFAACQRDAIEACAKEADRWAANYPVKVFPESGESVDCRAAHHGRHSSKVIAEDIRALAVRSRTP